MSHVPSHPGTNILRPRTALKPMTPEQQAFAHDALTRLQVPREEWDDFLDAIAGLVEAALDAQEAHLRQSRSMPPEIGHDQSDSTNITN